MLPGGAVVSVRSAFERVTGVAPDGAALVILNSTESSESPAARGFPAREADDKTTSPARPMFVIDPARLLEALTADKRVGS